MSEQQRGNGTAKGGAKQGGARGGKPGGVEPEQAAGEAEAVTGQDQAEGRQEAPGRGEGRPVRAGWGRYLVAPRPVPLLAGGVPPIEAGALFTLLEEDPEVEPLAQVRPSRSRGLGAIAEPHPACPPVAVVAMPDERARALAANPQVVVEPDQPLAYTPTPPLVAGLPVVDPAVAVTLEEPARVTVRVMGRDGQAVAGAHVWAIGAAAPAHAVTGPHGRATLILPADTPATVQALYVRPVGEYWPLRIDRPHLPETPEEGEAVIEVLALAETFEGFPDRPVAGWGLQAMRLHRIPPTYRGHGIKIALIDSGIDIAHPDLKDTVRAGYDFTAPGEDTWQVDATGHGTRCAGVIAAADNRTGITGIAAEAELHALKLFPHGRVSDLLQALDQCITHGIDIAQINLGWQAPSQLAAWKLLDAHAAGIAVIAPVGDIAGPITFPASLPTVLAVGALAHTGTSPAGSPQAATQPVWPGLYPPAFTPAGSGVDLVAPGAAVITTAPGETYTVADGTAMAAAHVTGLAAVLLAHHDDLRSRPQPRTAARVSYLLTLLRAACRPVPGADPARTGAGLPDAPTALGLPAPLAAAGLQHALADQMGA
ncbi:S8 family serine peptidase [Streptomyces sp. NPDC000880]